ncbi:MAG TPA: type IV toxin-antitoxin system AbiEi family antitoxin [Thermoanaerobaculia bacterium]
MPTSAPYYVTGLASRGRYTFTAAQAQAELGGSEVAVQAALRRLRKKGEIAMPTRGFYVIVPPEYRQLGCLPAAEFVPELMAYLDAPYYAGLLTAAQIHGAAHHKPQVFQVVTNRNRRPLGAGRVRVVFIAKANLEATPTTEVVTERGYLRVSTPEATAFDLVIYSGHAGGLNNVATVITELAERLEAEQLSKLARDGVPVASVQRLGFLLELTGHRALADRLASIIEEKSPPIAPLRAGHALRGALRDRRWHLGVNVDVEPDV